MRCRKHTLHCTLTSQRDPSHRGQLHSEAETHAHLGAGLWPRQLQRLCRRSCRDPLIQFVVNGVGRLLLPLPLLLAAGCPLAAGAAAPPAPNADTA